jgi:hypothetical protein
MPNKRNHSVTISKRPLEYKPKEFPQDFQSMPQLYLNMVENKDKVKDDVANVDYIPQPKSSPQPSDETSDDESEHAETSDDESGEHAETSDDESGEHAETSDDESEHAEASDDESGEHAEASDDESGENAEASDDESGEHAEASDDESGEHAESGDISDDTSVPSDAAMLSLHPTRQVSPTAVPYSPDSHASSQPDHNPDALTPDLADPLSQGVDIGSVTSRLSELIGNDLPDMDTYHPTPDTDHGRSNRGDGERRKRRDGKRRRRDGKRRRRAEPPSLTELEKRGEYQRDRVPLTADSIKSVDDDRKRELLFKFNLLRKSYPNSDIPTYSIHTKLSVIERAYEDSVRTLSLDSSVEKYKSWLIYGFMGCEFILGKYLKFDMRGFTEQQIDTIGSYKKLLVELGEKKYVPGVAGGGSSWPVEVRLLIMIATNAAFFVGSNILMKKTGTNIMKMMKTMTSKKPGNEGSQSTQTMRQPSADLSGL